MSTEETTSINLQNDITVNGKTYRAGQRVEVPKKQADDIARLDYDHEQYLKNLHIKRTAEVNSGTISVGS